MKTTPSRPHAQKDAGGWRSLNHFYDPLDTKYGKGLSDFAPDIRVLEGTNSFAWASISNCAGIPANGLNPVNIWSWQNARSYEWIGLTSTNKSDRFMALTNMFRAVGQVMHLLEDTSQPQHVRNEQHLDKYPYTPIPTLWRSPIEDYGKMHYLELNYQHSILDWRDDGFTKLEDFWDRGFYKANGVQALSDDAAATDPTKTLGLCRMVQRQFFFGARHLYPA